MRNIRSTFQLIATAVAALALSSSAALAQVKPVQRKLSRWVPAQHALNVMTVELG